MKPINLTTGTTPMQLVFFSFNIRCARCNRISCCNPLGALHKEASVNFRYSWWAASVWTTLDLSVVCLGRTVYWKKEKQIWRLRLMGVLGLPPEVFLLLLSLLLWLLLFINVIAVIIITIIICSIITAVVFLAFVHVITIITVIVITIIVVVYEWVSCWFRKTTL